MGSDGTGCRCRHTRAASTIVVVVVVLLTLAAPSPGSVAAPPSAEVPDAIVDRYLSRRPPLADEVTVIDVVGESNDRLLLATTLQGQLNRDEVRVYLVGAAWNGPDTDRFWLDTYEADGLVTVGDTIGLDAALDRFGPELSGFFLASASEGWTVNAATAMASVAGGVVATPATADALTSRGLPQLDDLRGRWSSGLEAYQDLVATYADVVDLRAVAVASEGIHGNRDLYVQQGILPIFTNPSRGDFEEVYELLDAFPRDHPIYGYISSTGEEEIIAILRIAGKGRYLVPSNTMDNLSFHLAVGAERPRATPAPSGDVIEECSPDDINVVLAVSDGDNLRVPLAELAADRWWTSPRRGEIPLGISISPATAVLMPSIWDHYASTADADMELVSMMGLGYTLTTFMDDPSAYYRDSFALGASLGLDTFWSLDPTLDAPDEPAWTPLLDAAATSGRPPSLYLFSYESFGGSAGNVTRSGVPYLRSRSSAFGLNPTELAAEVEALVDIPVDERPAVSFFAVTIWGSDLGGLADALGPLRDRGVRFLTLAEARACLTPNPPPVPPPTPSTLPTTAPPEYVPNQVETVPGRTAAPAQASTGLPHFAG